MSFPYQVIASSSITPKTISTVIAKPTKLCNADCDYCSAPPSDQIVWTLDDFKRYFDAIEPHLTDSAYWIWHGGEPMLLSPDFYFKADEYMRSSGRQINFSMQTNILLYDTKKWFDVFHYLFKGSLSTSFDPDKEHRKIKGNADAYSKRFYKKLDQVLKDGFRPMLISTFNRFSADLMHEMYDFGMGYNNQGLPFDLRFNYRYPAGREKQHLNSVDLLPPKKYGEVLIDVYNKWITDLPDFTVTPLNQMMAKVVGAESERCPWTKACGGRFLGLEPDGSIYNCSEFADLQDDEFKFGNINESTIAEMLQTKAASNIRKRRIDLPSDCHTCRHFKECEGGCARDAVLYERGLGGKFYYCQSWKMVFDRIKESVHSGEADGAVKKYFNIEY